MKRRHMLACVAVLACLGLLMLALRPAPTTPAREGEPTSWGTACVILNAGGDTRILRLYVADTEEKRSEGFRGKDRVDFLGVNASGMIFIWGNKTPSWVRFSMEGVKFELVLIHVKGDALINVIQVYRLKPNMTVLVHTYTDRDYFIELDPQALTGLKQWENILSMWSVRVAPCP